MLQIFGKSDLFEALVSFNEGDGATIGCKDLSIIAGIGLASPSAVRCQYSIKTKGLRCLHAPQRIAIRCARHHALVIHCQTIDDGKGGNSAGMRIQGDQQS